MQIFEYTDNYDDKCRFWRCADADFGCRMAGHEDYLDAGRTDGTDLLEQKGFSWSKSTIEHSWLVWWKRYLTREKQGEVFILFSPVDTGRQQRSYLSKNYQRQVCSRKDQLLADLIKSVFYLTDLEGLESDFKEKKQIISVASKIIVCKGDIWWKLFVSIVDTE